MCDPWRVQFECVHGAEMAKKIAAPVKLMSSSDGDGVFLAALNTRGEQQEGFSSYEIVESARPFYFWLLLAFSGKKELGVRIGGKVESEAWRLKLSPVSPRTFHWQRHPNLLKGKELQLLLPPGVRVKTLFLTDKVRVRPPNYEKECAPSMDVLRCVPQKDAKGFDPKRPWTGCRTPDDIRARQRLYEFQKWVLYGVKKRRAPSKHSGTSIFRKCKLGLEIDLESGTAPNDDFSYDEEEIDDGDEFWTGKFISIHREDISEEINQKFGGLRREEDALRDEKGSFQQK